jgi:pyruvate kinase
MVQVSREAEAALPYEDMIREEARQLENRTDDALSYDACRTAFQLNASLIIAFTESGGTAGRVSKYRPLPPILALTHDPHVQRRLTLRWGVVPVIAPDFRTVEDLFTVGEEQAIKLQAVRPGNLVVLVAGLPIGVTGGTNLLRVLTIEGGPDQD